jgi:class 3 adenylate cyclase
MSRTSRSTGPGLHTGTPHLTEEGYVGEDVHLGARIASAGHGGQVLLSAAIYSEGVDALVGGVRSSSASWAIRSSGTSYRAMRVTTTRSV